MRKYKILSLDVWGHGWKACKKWGCDGNCEGFTVNMVYSTNRYIEVADDADDAAIIKALVDAGELTPAALPKGTIEIDGESDDMLYVSETEEAQPLLHLACVNA